MADAVPLSARNPKVQELRRLLGRRSARQEAGRFVVEGPALVAEALRAGIEVEAVFAGGDGLATPAVAVARAGGVPVHAVAAGALERVGSTVAPQPVLAVAHRCDRAAREVLAAAGGRLVLVLAGVSDPGNAGTLVRSAEASGAGGVLFAGDAVDPFNPKVVRASAGSLFRMPFSAGVPAPDALALLAAAGYATIGTVPRGGAAFDDCDLTRPVAVVLGNEAHGLPDGVELDFLVTIPIAEPVESLNVAMAGTLICFEAARQRRVVSRGPAGPDT
ncbi:MAG: RNA methyltransferase [Actinobacteria bacterium]|nr:RNA methyltransferase [Actinomycetota bacterium]